MKYLSIVSLTLMILGGVWFVFEAYNIERLNTNIKIENEEVPLGFWMDEAEKIEEKEYYEDVENHWAKDSVMYIVDTQVMSLINDNEFMPNKYITRAEFITTLGRTENIDTMDRKVKNFKDVEETKFYAPYVAWAEENEILANEKENKFRPNDLITREEAAVMLAGYLENVRGEILIAGNGIKDLDKISTWAQDRVMLVLCSEYINGRNDGTFDPNAGMTRAELATLLTRMIKRLDL